MYNFSNMSHYQARVKVVKRWFDQKGKVTQDEVARSFNIRTRTLQRWVVLYRKGRLRGLRKKFWKRYEENLEQKIHRLKEENPWITTIEAEQILAGKGYPVSRKGIWSVWRRHGLAGFIKERFSLEYIQYIPVSADLESRLSGVEDALKMGELKKAVEIVNDLPVCPRPEVLQEIPDQMLSLPRRIEKLFTVKKTEPKVLIIKARRLRSAAERAHLRYSAVRVGIIEATVLSWFGDSERLLKLIEHLKDLLSSGTGKGLGADPAVRFSIHLLEGVGRAGLMQTRKALGCARTCQAIANTYPDAVELHDNLAGLFSSIGYFREAFNHLRRLDLKNNPQTLYRFGITLITAGRYRSALRQFQQVEPKLPGEYRYQLQQARALCYIGLGRIDQAVKLIQSSLEYAKSQAIGYYLHTGTLFHAACYAAYRDQNNALRLIKNFLPLLRKLGLWRDLYVRYLILGRLQKIKIDKGDLTPPLKVAHLLYAAQGRKEGCYWQAHHYAHTKGVVSNLHILLLFFPAIVRNLIKQGVDPKLPKSLLDLPVFRTEVPVYDLRFLGPFQIYRNNRPLRTHFPPQEVSLLVHISLRGGVIPLGEIYGNFWPKSDRPARNLSHLLVSLRRHLRITSRELYFSQTTGKLRFKPPITTDYQIFYETMTRARALKLIGEWSLAKREYLRAFRLFRGEPLKRLFDPWSDDLQRTVLNKLEQETTTFAKACLKHRNKRDAKKTLEKTSKIILYSEDIDKLLESL